MMHYHKTGTGFKKSTLMFFLQNLHCRLDFFKQGGGGGAGRFITLVLFQSTEEKKKFIVTNKNLKY